MHANACSTITCGDINLYGITIIMYIVYLNYIEFNI